MGLFLRSLRLILSLGGADDLHSSQVAALGAKTTSWSALNINGMLDNAKVLKEKEMAFISSSWHQSLTRRSKISCILDNAKVVNITGKEKMMTFAPPSQVAKKDTAWPGGYILYTLLVTRVQPLEPIINEANFVVTFRYA